MFTRVVRQVACDFKSPAARAEFERQADRPSPTVMQLLPDNTKQVVEPVTLCKLSDLVLSEERAGAIREFIGGSLESLPRQEASRGRIPRASG
jgi:hypothetical protein